jgi:hypothetical protein
MAVRITVRPRNVELVKKGLEDFTGETVKVSKGRLYGRMAAARAKVIKQPARFQGPYPWKTEKQRRYVMWAIRHGVIVVPYKRTGEYARRWQIASLDDGYRLENPLPHAKYVGGSAYGDKQARIHQKRWALLRDAIEEALAELPKEVADHIVLVARRRGYVAQ